MAYGEKNQWSEWLKYIVYRTGSIFGFPQAWVGCIVGCSCWMISWCLLPGGFILMLDQPIIGNFLVYIGATPHSMKILNIIVIALGTMAGLLCWASVAVSLMPDTFDRHKIHNKLPWESNQ